MSPVIIIQRRWAQAEQYELRSHGKISVVTSEQGEVKAFQLLAKSTGLDTPKTDAWCYVDYSDESLLHHKAIRKLIYLLHHLIVDHLSHWSQNSHKGHILGSTRDVMLKE